MTRLRQVFMTLLCLVCVIPSVNHAGSLENEYDSLQVNGFLEMRAGRRTQDDPNEDDWSMGEARVQLELEQELQAVTIRAVTDLLYDAVAKQQHVSLEDGEGPIDVREASALGTVTDWLDVKAGRQILTWGTGDLVFINDLFPKDWNSFFIGRDIEYLKAPSDAIRLAAFSSNINIDVVYTPRFDADRYVDADRISYYDPSRGRRIGKHDKVNSSKPDKWFDDDEVALRLYGNIAGNELAIYAYRGFWKSPAGRDASSGRLIFPELAVYGASLRGSAGPGIGHMEFGFYDSLDDGKGNNPRVRNSEWRFLLGYEWEAAREFTTGIQYYQERIVDYNKLQANLPPGQVVPDEDRHVVTLRLEKRLMNQDLNLSLFTYYSPSDRDGYIRPQIHYQINDSVGAELGGNVFFGQKEYTFFGQFEKNTNVYAGIRFSF